MFTKIPLLFKKTFIRVIHFICKLVLIFSDALIADITLLKIFYLTPILFFSKLIKVEPTKNICRIWEFFWFSLFWKCFESFLVTFLAYLSNKCFQVRSMVPQIPWFHYKHYSKETGFTCLKKIFFGARWNNSPSTKTWVKLKNCSSCTGGEKISKVVLELFKAE